MALLFLLLFGIYREAFRTELIIDPISVPRRYEETGLTAEVMADRVGDALREIEVLAGTTIERDNLVRLKDEEAAPDVSIPGTKLELKTVVELARELIGIHPKHVRGDLVVRPPTLRDWPTILCHVPRHSGSRLRPCRPTQPSRV